MVTVNLSQLSTPVRKFRDKEWYGVIEPRPSRQISHARHAKPPLDSAGLEFDLAPGRELSDTNDANETNGHE